MSKLPLFPRISLCVASFYLAVLCVAADIITSEWRLLVVHMWVASACFCWWTETPDANRPIRAKKRVNR